MALWQIFGETNHNFEVPGKNLPNKVFAHNGSEGEEPQRQTATWPRPLAQKWTVMLFLGTCLLYCARMAMPICAVNMATTFGWSKTQSGVVMGGFFWGYCFTQVLGGHVSDRIGGERVLLLATTSWASITACTPLLAQLGISSLTSMTVARFLMGLLQGVHYPSLASLCSQRVDEGERGFLMSTMGSGSYMGQNTDGGRTGVRDVGTLWLGECVLWRWSALRTVVIDCVEISTERSNEHNPSAVKPWIQFGSVKETLAKNVQTALCVFMSMGVSSVFLLLLCRPLSFPSAVIFVSAAVGLATFNSSGVSVNVQDLAPSCAGALFGFMNMCGAFTGLVLVYVSGYLIEVTASWGYVFSLITMVNTMGLGVFLMFGEANRVDLWNLSQVTRV
ncbi:solute carrier family 17 member 9 isoform X3 [Salmo trutta]|uniref:solute carrier family 17 member 9 isoform X3 n=1 Tax=Salmo trutta TaxID=8032 RepID=UPI0011321B9A|nr:solute carrier family 17 member 9-like isoform X3 [Salmo trutta]